MPKIHVAFAAAIIAVGSLHAAPTPDPMTWDVVPVAISETEITMTASTATDPGGVEYYFTESSGNPGGADSGWQASPAYTNTGLSPDTTYTYTVKARELSGLTETAASTAESATTTVALVTETFTYPAGGSVSGNDGGEGFAGAWSNTRGNPSLDSGLAWGDLLSAGDAARGAAWSGLIRPLDTTLSDTGLLDNGATLWFSVILDLTGQNASNADLNLALTNATKFESGDFGNRENLTPATAEGIGVTHSGAVIQAVYWQDAGDADAFSERTENSSSLVINGTSPNLSHALIVGKIDWGVDDAADEMITLYGPDTALAQGSPIMAEWTIPALDQSSFNQLAIQFKDTPKIDEIRMGASYNEVVTWDFGTNPDNTAPTPDPMTFETGPTGVTSSVITMTATEADDPSGVEYFFTCTSANAPDSGWQSSRVYTVTGLTPETTYTYTVMARDLSPAQNTTAASAPASGDTLAVDSTPPTPDPMTFASVPTAISNTEITMEASTATDDLYDVEYYFTCTVGGGPDSGWQSGTTFTATGLTPDTSYTYTVTARDTSPNLNETAASAPETISTLPTDDTPPGPNTWAVVPTVVSDTEITMTATTATDDQYGVEYYFANTTIADGSHDSGWQASPTYNDTGLDPFTSYTYRVTLRDLSYNLNESVGDPLPAVTNADPAVTDPTLVESTFNWLSSQNAPTSNIDFDVSVVDGKAFFSGQGNYPGNIARTVFSYFGDGTVLDYRFFREGATADTIDTYASGAAGLISNVATAKTGLGNDSWADVWTTSDPGFDFLANPGDVTGNTVITNVTNSSNSLTGSVDISGMTEGTIYFLYGSYRATPNIDLVMSGTGQTDVILNDIGDNDGANNNENYIVAANFLNAGDYQTISYTLQSNNGRFMGVVLEGESTVTGSAYATWASTNAPTTGDDPSADEDGDGVSNGVEFVLGGAIGTDDLDKLPTTATDGTDMSFTFVRDQNSIEASTVVTIEVSTDLADWTTGSSPYAVPDTDTGGVVNPGVTVVDNADGTDTVTLTVPQSPDAKKFARLKVVVTP